MMQKWERTQNINYKTNAPKITKIAVAQAKAGNTSEKLLSEIHQIVYSLCQAKKVKTNITIANKAKKYITMNSIKL